MINPPSKVRAKGRIASHKKHLENKQLKLQSTFVFSETLKKHPEIFSSAPPAKRAQPIREINYCPICDTEEPLVMKHCFKCSRCTLSLRFHCNEKSCMEPITGLLPTCRLGHPVCTADLLVIDTK